MTEEGGHPEARYTHRLAWGPSARMRARSRLRDAIDDKSDLLTVVEAAASVIREELAAKTVTVTLLQDDYYRDLVKVGDYAPEEAVDPDERFPASDYPQATARLLAHQAYVSGSDGKEVVQEHLQIVPPDRVSGFMGVPIVAAGEVRGEVFATRRASEPAFTEDDVSVARDLATELGISFPGLLSQD
ncbi:MAG TPA: GAF domain-containing protein [Actinomycetes bacterium]|nr:GAF domain-containing protein [Actinomycetes bacterium]